MTVKSINFTGVKMGRLTADSPARIYFPMSQVLASHRKEEKLLLKRLKAEARMPERYPQQ